jgi:hypothetical protein
VVAVLLSLSAMVLAHGALVLARQQALAGAASRNALAARAGAESAAIVVARQRLPDAPQQAPLLAVVDSVSGTWGGTFYRGILRRLGVDLWLAEGAASEGVATAIVARTFRTADPERLLSALGAVVSVGVAPAGDEVERVDETTFQLQPEPAPPGGCTSVPADVPPIEDWGIDERSRERDVDNPLDPVRLASGARQVVTGLGRPGPRVLGGECVDDGWNWGDVNRPGGACAGRMAAVAAEHGTVAVDGSGQGLLVGQGDLTLSGVALFGGVLVAGRLRLERGSVVTGFVRAGGGLEVTQDSRVRGSYCWAIHALSVEPVLEPFPVPGGGWMRMRP